MAQVLGSVTEASVGGSHSHR
ncbi:uncharacterized protein G2W53_025351 [Senna tora]|uniref:Uncharacterized protein n=1 Tax=Senna tora TaxID=362788 RepID=A0A834TEN6_9FABA|nr:uncharacterized protein G2W53_025351 [Senna tora]